MASWTSALRIYSTIGTSSGSPCHSTPCAPTVYSMAVASTAKKISIVILNSNLKTQTCFPGEGGSRYEIAGITSAVAKWTKSIAAKSILGVIWLLGRFVKRPSCMYLVEWQACIGESW